MPSFFYSEKKITRLLTEESTGRTTTDTKRDSSALPVKERKNTDGVRRKSELVWGQGRRIGKENKLTAAMKSQTLEKKICEDDFFLILIFNFLNFFFNVF